MGDHGAAEREERYRAGSVPRPRALGLYRDLLGATVPHQFPAEGEPGYVGLQLGPSRLSTGAIVAWRR